MGRRCFRPEVDGHSRFWRNFWQNRTYSVDCFESSDRLTLRFSYWCSRTLDTIRVELNMLEFL